jgi:sugar phosphate isomerase/epimerase
MPGGRRIGVCSWSLQPTNARELAERVRETGVRAVQLALDPIRTDAMQLEEVRAALAAAGVSILSGMMAMAGEDYTTLESIRRTGGVVPDATWDENVAAAAANARLARTLDIRLVTFHAGFVPHDPDDPQRAVLLQRLAALAQIFGEEGVEVALETGQERAETLAQLLEQLRPARVGVNFDPANIILYGVGDPVASLRWLAPNVRQVHIKDALPAAQPGEWGAEVPAGEGAVDWPAFLTLLDEAGIAADLVIEREAGEARVADVRLARELLRRNRC